MLAECYSQILVSEDYSITEIGCDSWQINKKFLENKDTTALKKQLDSKKGLLVEKGFFEADYQWTVVDSQSLQVICFCGPKYTWESLGRGNLSEALSNKINFKPKFFTDKTAEPTKIRKIQKKIVDIMADGGYPFANVFLDTLSIDSGNIEAQFRLQPGPKIIYDTIIISQEVKINQNWLRGYLGISPEKNYREKDIRNIRYKLGLLPFLSLKGQPVLTFSEGKAAIQLPLQNRSASQIDGIVGLLPNEESPNELLLTGEFNIKLQNLFRSGKSLQVQWLRQKSQSQQLDMSYGHPRILGSPLDIKLRFGLLKEDTSFLNIDRMISIGINMARSGTIFFIAGLKNSEILGNGNSNAELSNTQFNNSRLFNYGLGYSLIHLDDLIYPHSGIQLGLEATAGTRTLTQNILDGSASVSNSAQLSATGDISTFIPIRNRWVLLNRFQGGYIENSPLFFNELYRLGGLNTMRGFNQNFFFASRYGIFTSELRVFLESSTYFMIFADQGYMFYDLETSFSEDFPLGIGLGFSFASSGGIFNFVYALGRDQTQRFVFTLSKIHFGYVSRF